VTFIDCVLYCAGNREMVHHFDRLRGTNLSLRGGGLALAIDQATGRLDHDLALFIEFVWDCVWTRLPPDTFAPSQLAPGTRGAETDPNDERRDTR
jgi:hypothetical protein